jgi:hypothetical protein
VGPSFSDDAFADAKTTQFTVGAAVIALDDEALADEKTQPRPLRPQKSSG